MLLHHFILIKIKSLNEIAFNGIAFNCIYKTFTVPCEKSSTVSFASSIIKNNVVFASLSKFAVKLIC